VPLERNTCFTGRETVLARLRAGLCREGRAGISQVQAIAGLGGVGKTQTALEYAYRYFYEVPEAERYQAVFWLRVDTEQALQSGFQEIATALKLPQAEAQEPEIIIQAVQAWLADHDGWLLVLDNADDPSFVGPYLPRQGRGHVLITSRVPDLQSLGVIRPLALDALDPDEARDFLLKRTARAGGPQTPNAGGFDPNSATVDGEGDSEPGTTGVPPTSNLSTPQIWGAGGPELTAAATLAAELGYLPLALEQAGAFIVTTDARFQDYLTSYRRRRLELLNQGAPMMGAYRDPVATTWNLNFAAVEAESPAAADLLRASAFLHPDSIPYDLMVSGAALLGEAIKQALAEAEEDPLAFVTLLTPLKRYSLVRSDAGQTYSLHRLVQAVVRANLGDEAERLWAERVVRVVTQAYPNADDFNNWGECERLLLHSQSVIAEIHQYDYEFFEAGLLLVRVGFYIRERGQYSAIEPLYQKGLEIQKKALGDEDPEIAKVINNLAALYRSQGRYEAAEPLYEEALAMRKALLGESHPAVATSLNNLAALYESQGRYEEAAPLYEEALAMRKALLGEAHPDVATSLNDLGNLYKAKGDYSKAEPFLKEAVELYKKLLGEEHPWVATSLNNLAALYQSQGRYDAAESLYQEALAMRQALLGEAHPDVATSLNDLAALYRSQGRYEAAEPLYQEALAMCKALLGEAHPHVATSLNNLALLYQSQGRYEAAEPLYQEALAMYKALLGEAHPAVANTLWNLGALRYNQRRFAEAESFLLEALPIFETKLGIDHPRTQNLRGWLNAVQNALAGSG